MINRVLIRTKIVQLLYSFYMKEPRNQVAAESELQLSMEKSYELYHRLLLLPAALTDMQLARLEQAKSKFIPTDSERNPNMRFVENRFVAQLRENRDMLSYCKERPISWVDESDLLRLLLDKILASSTYTEYMKSEVDNYETDREFWRKIFKSILLENEDLTEMLESSSLYWNDDLTIIGTFALKTIKQFDPAQGAAQPLLAMYKDSEDAEFVLKLFRCAIGQEEENRKRIDQYTKNWELERVAFMDVVIMLVALAEIENFPEIPLSVTMNEYIEIAKVYSTPRSGVFINGVLDAVIKQLKKEGLLTK